jgi:hypothetical protein
MPVANSRLWKQLQEREIIGKSHAPALHMSAEGLFDQRLDAELGTWGKKPGRYEAE